MFPLVGSLRLGEQLLRAHCRKHVVSTVMTEYSISTANASTSAVIVAERHSQAAWLLYIDLLAALIAASLPWSTSSVSILGVIWLSMMIPTVEARAFLRTLSNPACLLPLVLFTLAVVGMLWGDTSWLARSHGVSPVAKFFVIPFLIYHFQRSHRGHWVFIAFLASSSALLMLSWIVLFVPELAPSITGSAGVPVKNYIDQSQEFTLCMMALAPLVVGFYSRRQLALMVGCTMLMAGFFASLMFVAMARSAFVYLPVLIALFAISYLRARASAFLLLAVVAVATLAWFTSPYLRGRIASIPTQYQSYEQDIPVSIGQRLEYWHKSIGFFASSPLLGNGTGSTRQLFERDAVGKIGLAAEVVANPHNQTLNVAVQWGAIGIVVLYAMWLVHLLLFRGDGIVNWIGLIVVVQNLFSSLFNSHLFDFVEGWIYVLGVGVAGGMLLASKPSRLPSAGPSNSRNPTMPTMAQHQAMPVVAARSAIGRLVP